MSYEIYCDESRHVEKDLKDRFMVVGGVYLPSAKRDEIETGISSVRKRHDCFGEFKWNNVAPSKLQFYIELTELFFSSDLYFRCIVIDKAQLKHEEFNEGSHEIFFYKTYYILLKKPICNFHRCQIYIATKDKYSGIYSKELVRILRKKLMLLSVSIPEPVIMPAKSSVFIQLADLLIGAVGYQHNNYHTNPSSSKAKIEICNLICSKIAKPNLIFSSSYTINPKFEIFIPRLK